MSKKDDKKGEIMKEDASSDEEEADDMGNQIVKDCSGNKEKKVRDFDHQTIDGINRRVIHAIAWSVISFVK